MLGYTPEDWASSPDFFVEHLHPDDLERVLTETAHLIADRRAPIEFRLLRRDGSVAWVRDEAVLVRDEAGEPLCIQGYILDITERKEREAAVRQATRARGRCWTQRSTASSRSTTSAPSSSSTRRPSASSDTGVRPSSVGRWSI